MHDYVAAPHTDFTTADHGRPPKPPSHSTWVVVFMTTSAFALTVTGTKPGWLLQLLFIFFVIPPFSEAIAWVRSMVRYGFRRLRSSQLG